MSAFWTVYRHRNSFIQIGPGISARCGFAQKRSVFCITLGMRVRAIILAGFGVLVLICPPLHGASSSSVGMWVCKDAENHTVFTNRVRQYQNCRPYVPALSLPDLLDKQMRNREKEDTALEKLLDNARSSGKIMGPL